MQASGVALRSGHGLVAIWPLLSSGFLGDETEAVSVNGAWCAPGSFCLEVALGLTIPLIVGLYLSSKAVSMAVWPEHHGV